MDVTLPFGLWCPIIHERLRLFLCMFGAQRLDKVLERDVQLLGALPETS